MRAQLVLYILGALASTCVAEEAACAAGDPDDDRCTLLQGTLGVSKTHGEEDNQPVLAEHDAKSMDHVKEELEGPWGDIFKKVKAVMGGGDALMKDFDGVKHAAATFQTEVHAHVTTLTSGVAPPMGLHVIRGKVEAFYMGVHDSAKKLWEALKKVTDAWLNGLGKVAPAALQSAMKNLLGKVSEQGKHFADAFKTAADDLKKVNQTAICSKVKHSLHSVLKKASDLAKSATGLSTNGLSKDIKAARDALPEALKKEIEKMLAKANGAADRMLRKLTDGMKEITHGVAKAFEDHCTGLPHSGAGQVGVLLALVVSALSFSM